LGLPSEVMTESGVAVRRMQSDSHHARYSQAQAGVVRAFPALLPGQNFGKMMVREARQA
jgi:hypothetical protein